jgi:hypothetical protein
MFTADLLEHVMETNGSYYWVSKQYRMPWYMLYNLDVVSIFLLPALGLFAACFAVCRHFMSRRTSMKVKDA